MPECNEIYWDKINKAGLYLQQCSHCHRFIFYPRSLCPYCWESELDWKQVSGQGRVYSFTVVHLSALPEFAEETPYIYAIIELAEGVRIPGTIVNCPVNEIKVDMPVEILIIEKRERKLPVFRKIES